MSQPKPSSKDRVRAHRERMRAKGLRPVTVWTFDLRRAEVRDQISRECRALAELERTHAGHRADAEWVFAHTDAMMRELDETEPYDWGPEGPPV